MYRLSKAAAQDIEDILRQSLAEFGLAQTEDYLQSLTQCLGLLGENPKMGNAVEDIRPGYRRFIHGSHLVFYKFNNPGILIVRILHKHMDATRHI
jgi:toxin ParE1/3/4